MKKYFWMKLQLVYVAVILLWIFGLTIFLVGRFNSRWDLTREKIYSLADSTAKLLSGMSDSKIEVLAFYPKEDPARLGIENFLKECQLHHRQFYFNFYDPDRRPGLAKEWNVKDPYTVILRYENRQERLVGPTEESFTNALFRLANPKALELCFVTGHGEAPLDGSERNGLKSLRELLEESNYNVHEIVLARDSVPELCHVVIVAGPHFDFDTGEFEAMREAIRAGKGTLFLIDPMDPGTGKPFNSFLNEFGITIGDDVIVDKMSRMVGGDILVPLVTRYVNEHPITSGFNLPTFFPVTRSVQLYGEGKIDGEVIPLALTSDGTWAERDLATLEKGDATFDSTSDLSGPIAMAAAYEKKAEGELPTREESEGAVSLKKKEPYIPGRRLVVIGDSDFVTNPYLRLAGNQTLIQSVIRWLAKDARAISVGVRAPEFKPLLLDRKKKVFLVGCAAVGLPIFFLILGVVQIKWRERK